MPEESSVKHRCPKGRLFVVDDDTLKRVENDNIVEVKVPDLRKYDENKEISVKEGWLKTVVDISADMLQLEIGDYIFLWQTKEKAQKNEKNEIKEKHRCRIFGVYRVVSAPYYEMTTDKDEFPFKVKVERAYKFNEPVDEYDVMNSPLTKGAVWTIWGKKIASKSRGSTPLTFEGVQYLLSLLMWKNNGNYEFYGFGSEEIISNPLKLGMPDGIYVKKTLRHTSEISMWKQINPNELCLCNKVGGLACEKVFEAIFNQMVVERKKNFFDQLDINVDEIVWFANYLPYSFEKNEMDYLLMLSKDGYNITDYILIEFMLGKTDVDHIRRCYQYAEWLDTTYGSGKPIVQPILISEGFPRNIGMGVSFNACREVLSKCKRQEKVRSIKMFSYEIDRNGISFKEDFVETDSL